jgi:L-Ala-D/L-Glu epimerase
VKIDRIRTGVVSQANRDAGWRRGLAKLGGDSGIVIELSCDGLTGLGYATEAPYTGDLIEGMREVVERVVRPVLDRSDPRKIPELMRRLDLGVLGYSRVKAAVEVALLDLVAKSAGLPMYALLGGKQRDSIEVIRIVSIKSPSEMAASAEQVVSEGFRHLKLKVGHDGMDLLRARAVRSAVGPDVELILDPSGEWTPKQAITQLRAMEDAGIAVVEQPTRPGDDAGLAMVRAAVTPVVEADESADSLARVYRVASAGAADGVVLKTPKLGGPLSVLRAAAVCEAANIACRFGKSGESRLSALVDLHVSASLSTIGVAGELGEFARKASDPTEGVEVVDGRLILPDVPGHGASLRVTDFLS